MPAQAAVSSASINELTATLKLDGANDNVTVSVAGGVLVHGQTTGGLASGTDWDSATDGVQTVPADRRVHGHRERRGRQRLAGGDREGHGDRQLGLSGEDGDDVLTGADTNDTLDGDTATTGSSARAAHDVMNGGAGNDTAVWNNGDGTDADQR